MTKELKLKLFKAMQELEDYDGNCQQAEGAYKMLEVLGLGREYIHWSMVHFENRIGMRGEQKMTKNDFDLAFREVGTYNLLDIVTEVARGSESSALCAEMSHLGVLRFGDNFDFAALIERSISDCDFSVHRDYFFFDGDWYLYSFNDLFEWDGYEEFLRQFFENPFYTEFSEINSLVERRLREMEEE